MVGRRVGILILFLLLLAPASEAGLISFFGGERVGTSGGQFLRVPAGARPIAMGGGMSAAISGAASPFWNPAGMGTVRSTHSVFLSHMEYAADIDVDHFGYVYRMRSWHLGLSGGMLRSGDILRTSELHPSGAGYTFNANQFMAAVSLGRRMTDRFYFAGTAKLLQENLDEFENRAIFVDLGALYYVGFRQARIGFTVRNFGGDLRLNENPPQEAEVGARWQSFAAPTVAVFGFAYDFGHNDTQRLTVNMDFHHPSDEAESIILGGELALRDRLYLRGGYRNNVHDGGTSLGFGVRIWEKARTLQLDYAFDDRGSFGGLHIVSLELGR